jgi:hypothetical protein
MASAASATRRTDRPLPPLVEKGDPQAGERFVVRGTAVDGTRGHPSD